MLTHPTLNQLSILGLHGMAKAFAELAERAETDSLTHAEWLAFLLEKEASHRHDRRLAARLRYARLRHMAAPEDVDWKAARGLDRALFASLMKGGWIDACEALILTGPTDPDSYCTPRYLIETQDFAGADVQKADAANGVHPPRA